ncbi:hypothetical protein SAMN02910356_01658 [Selenomonas sp. GACV-9]|uniref:hypothetical protein n=1 Tax=Selenomonas sp. GACV-9 TaxID=3158782 RepID=UPI0008EBEFEC|nr:hypothetical protein SAMN02910356_01658 [Selenomonas ruminantium]
MRRVVLLLFALVMMVSVTASAAERVPLRVAQLPIQVTCYNQPEQQVLERLERQVDHSLHVPLNETLQAVEFIPEADCLKALKEVATELGGKPDFKDMARPLAEKLQADLVVIPIVAGYEQYTYMSWNWDRGQMLHSYVSIRIVGYDRYTDEVFKKRSSRRYDDEYMPYGEVRRLAGEAMDESLRRARVHDRVWNWKTNIR